MTNHTYVIAEAGVNHNGELARALDMIDIASEAGVDAVKFQTFLPEALASTRAPKAGYQAAATGTDQSQLDMLKSLALPFDAHRELLERCHARGVDFISSPFDFASARMLIEELGLQCIKVGSGELTNGPLLLDIARSGVDIILSTGMANLDEITEALAVIACGYLGDASLPTPAKLAQTACEPSAADLLRKRVSLLHCTTAYPCPLDEVNLRAMDTLRARFGLRTGYSDHSLGITVAVAAAARGAQIIEKHFTLDPTLPGPDQAASLDPLELKQMTAAIRIVEASLGHADKQPTISERDNMLPARKGLCAARAIAAGEKFSAENLAIKRPAEGRSPNELWSLIDQPATRDYQPDEPIQ